jgi:hypothetical protein
MLTLPIFLDPKENMQKVNIAKNVLDKFNPFFRLEKLNPEDQSWIVVWKSEVSGGGNTSRRSVERLLNVSHSRVTAGYQGQQ